MWGCTAKCRALTSRREPSLSDALPADVKFARHTSKTTDIQRLCANSLWSSTTAMIPGIMHTRRRHWNPFCRRYKFESAYVGLANSHRPRHVRTNGKAVAVLTSMSTKKHVNCPLFDMFKLSLCDVAIQLLMVGQASSLAAQADSI
jgi:hypothetical protein